MTTLPAGTATTLLAFDQPPVGTTTPTVPQTIITVILGTVVAGFVIAALIDWRRLGRPTFLLMIVGGYVCSFNEPLIDFLCHCYFPPTAGSGTPSSTARSRSG